MSGPISSSAGFRSNDRDLEDSDIVEDLNSLHWDGKSKRLSLDKLLWVDEHWESDAIGEMRFG